jgi:hypothetical protein
MNPIISSANSVPSLLPIALECVKRGWHILPCWPRTKKPMTHNGVLDASSDEATVRSWWTRCPDANIAVATGPSRLSVVDCDHGNRTEQEAREWMVRAELPKTYTVRTGRRFNTKDGTPECGVQLYYADTMPSVGEFSLGGSTGQIKSLGGYVMARGSIHPDSGEAYELMTDAPIAGLPELVRALKTERKPVEDDGERISENRNVRLTSIAGKLRNAGLSASALEVALIQVNVDRCSPPLEDEEVERIATNAAKWEIPESPPQITIGGKSVGVSEPVDWHTRYMTEESYLNVKPPEFLVDGFLVKDSIAMLGGPVAQRKSIIALNVAHALCTGEALFGYFTVTEKPTRTVYLCPEMGAASFVKRIKQIGLGDYVGKTLFIQTMSEQPTVLDELDGELPGAVVIVDTITRFIEGDENKSEDMRRFAQKVFRLVNAGATVVLLHHSKKGSSGTLDDGLRGSSELAAFVDSCWVTELEDTTKPYESLSKMRNVKQRDFESDPFRLKPAPGSFYLTMEGDPAPEAVIRGRREEAARDALKAILTDSPNMGINKLRDALKAKGYGKGQKWITLARCEMLGAGVSLSSD